MSFSPSNLVIFLFVCYIIFQVFNIYVKHDRIQPFINTLYKSNGLKLSFLISSPLSFNMSLTSCVSTLSSGPHEPFAISNAHLSKIPWIFLCCLSHALAAAYLFLFSASFFLSLCLYPHATYAPRISLYP